MSLHSRNTLLHDHKYKRIGRMKCGKYDILVGIAALDEISSTIVSHLIRKDNLPDVEYRYRRLVQQASRLSDTFILIQPLRRACLHGFMSPSNFRRLRAMHAVNACRLPV